MSIENLANRIVDISYQEKLSHLSSTLSTLMIVNDIFSSAQDDDVVIVTNKHAKLALCVALEHYYGLDPLNLLHGSNQLTDRVYCPLDLSVAAGWALSNTSKKVHCVISDGECTKGTTWEALGFITDNNIDNLNVYVNLNGITGYSEPDISALVARLCVFAPNVNIKISKPLNWPFAQGIQTHHCVLTEDQYQLLRSTN